MNPQSWDKDKNEVKRTFEGHSDLNEKIKSIELRIIKVLNRYQNENNVYPSKEELKKLLTKEFRNKDLISETDKLKTFWGYVDHFIKQSINGIRKNSTGDAITNGTIKCYVTLKNLLLSFEKDQNKKIQFANIDLDFYADFTEYLQNKKVLKKNTISKHIRTLKTILREAFDNEYHQNLKFNSKRFSAPNEMTTAIYLNEKELNELYSYNLNGKPGLEKVRDLFIVGCYTGLRFSDLHQVNTTNIKPDHENPKDLYLHIKQIKTKQVVTIPVHDIVLELLNKYNQVLPKPISIQKTNAHLKEICKLLPSFNKSETIEYTKGGKRISQFMPKYLLISSHTARRSFATNSYLKGHITGNIMAVTGHRTESSFNKYIRVTPMEKARSFKLHEDKQKNELRIAK